MSIDQDLTQKKFIERLKESFRVIVYDPEDHSEIRSFDTSLLKLYTIIGVICLVVIIFTVAFITLTPLKTLIPGYGDIKSNENFILLTQKVDELEAELEAQLVYTQGLQNMLSADNNDAIDIKKSIDNLEFNKTDKYVNPVELEETKKTKELNRLIFRPPVKGVISAEFDIEKKHYGIDIIAAKNTPIVAAMEGKVINADWTVETGNTIFIQHDQNIVSAYKHNSALLVKTGDRVKTGQAIAIIGNTGKLTDGPHLHFELWYDGQAVNPQNFVDFN